MIAHCDRLLASHFRRKTDLEDIRQDILLRLLEKHKESGIALFPCYQFIKEYCFWKSINHGKAKRYRRVIIGLDDCISEETRALSYGFNAEECIDIVRQLRDAPRYKAKRHANYYKFNDLTGQIYGDWKVVSLAPPGKHKGKLWRVRCVDCGRESVISANSLRTGRSRFCSKTRSVKFVAAAIKNLHTPSREPALK